MFYAQLDENSICVGVSELAGEVKDSRMVLIDNYQEGLLNKKYVNGKWEEVPLQLIPLPPDSMGMSQEQAQRLLTAKATLGIVLPVETEVEAQAALLEGLPLPEPEPSGEWVAKERVISGVVRSYKGADYECLLAHVTQEGWEPPNTLELPELWKEVSK